MVRDEKNPKGAPRPTKAYETILEILGNRNNEKFLEKIILRYNSTT